MMEEAEELARELLRQKILICGGAALGVASLPVMLSHIKVVVPEATLRVVLTPRAHRLVSTTALASITDAPVLSDWPDVTSAILPHIALAEWADLVLVMPATADLLARAATGIANDLVTTCLIATEAPQVFVPSMNPRMWRNPIVQDNVARLRKFGRFVVEPSVGRAVATGALGVGALPPLRDLLIELLRITTGEAQ